ncbi:MAG: (4Fe-4S)-binding protein [Chitinophagales bacterium]
MNRKITKQYSNGEVTVVWKNYLCWHSGNCVRGLPQVFDRTKHPWVNAEGANTEEIIEQVKKCPSRALSYFMNNETERGNFEEQKSDS